MWFPSTGLSTQTIVLCPLAFGYDAEVLRNNYPMKRITVRGKLWESFLPGLVKRAALSLVFGMPGPSCFT